MEPLHHPPSPPPTPAAVLPTTEKLLSYQSNSIGLLGGDLRYVDINLSTGTSLYNAEMHLCGTWLKK